MQKILESINRMPSVCCLAIGVVAGSVLSRFGLFGILLLLGGLSALAYHKGYRLRVERSGRRS